jgi:hypothetical protein
MSRGPGKWQRAILEALERSEVVPLSELLPEPDGEDLFAYLRACLADVSALERAARMLHRKDRIGLFRTGWWQPSAMWHPTTTLIASRLGWTPPENKCCNGTPTLIAT